MLLSLKEGNIAYAVDLAGGVDISLPVHFEKEQLSAFGGAPATASAFSIGETKISVGQGAGCNCDVLTFSVHLNGTHTECVGHISRQPHRVQEVANIPAIMKAQLISVSPVPAEKSGESYLPAFKVGDEVITKPALQVALGSAANGAVEALILRTLPNGGDKKHRDYSAKPSAFFTNEAMEYLAGLGVEHLLVDMPSVDRLADEGRLSNHHIFWGVEQGSHDVTIPSPKTITELVYVPDAVTDGLYALALNLANIRSDATLSRPVLYEMRAE